jgi:DNA-binding transcriptional MocR family regulator
MKNYDHRPEIQRLLGDLEDPFEIFPLQSIARSLSQFLAESEERLAGRQGHFGVARQYWDVESEHLHAESGLLLGATFVLGQTALTQTISLLSRLRSLDGGLSAMPRSRVPRNL